MIASACKADQDSQGTNTTPQGRSPTLTRAFTARLSTSTIDTSPDGPFAVKTVLPSGATAIPHGRSPTSIVATGSFVFVSMITTFFPRPVVMNTCEPSGAATDPIGLTNSPANLIVFSTTCVIASRTQTSAPFSAGT